jgi:two-component system chemotaxis response regulator CheV
MAGRLLESIDLSTQLAGSNRLALLLFRLGPRQIFGINVFKVQEVITTPAIAPVPGAHPLVRGIADLRGGIVPIIDLGSALGEIADQPPAHVIVTEYNRSVQGFLVRSVERIIQVDVEKVQPPPGSASNTGYLTAVTRHGDELVQVVDVEKVLSEVTGEPPALSSNLVGRGSHLTAGRRVLVADDSRVARAQIERVLREIGVECVLVNDGREALQFLQATARHGPLGEQLAMVISDIEMPNMDGYTLTTEIRRDERLKDIHVILHTSLSGVFNKAMVQRVRADRFIAKFGADELARTVLEQLEKLALQASAGSTAT